MLQDNKIKAEQLQLVCKGFLFSVVCQIKQTNGQTSKVNCSNNDLHTEKVHKVKVKVSDYKAPCVAKTMQDAGKILKLSVQHGGGRLMNRACFAATGPAVCLTAGTRTSQTESWGGAMIHAAATDEKYQGVALTRSPHSDFH